MDMPVLAVTIGLLASLVAVCLLPVRADSAEDRGDGRTEVIIPSFTKTSPRRPRTWTFLGAAAVLGLIFVEWQRPSALYVGAVSAVASAITHHPATVNGYAARLRPATLFFAVAYMIGIGLVMRGGPARRVCVMAHSVLYVSMTLLTHVLMIVIGMVTGLVDRAVRHRGHPGQPAHRRAGHHAADVHLLRPAPDDHGAGPAAHVEMGHDPDLVRADLGDRSAGGRLRGAVRAGQPDLGLAGVRAAVRGGPAVHAHVRAAVAAVVDQPPAAVPRRGPPAGRRDHPGLQRGGEHRPGARVDRRGRRALRRAGAGRAVQRRVVRRHRGTRPRRDRAVQARSRRDPERC